MIEILCSTIIYSNYFVAYMKHRLILLFTPNKDTITNSTTNPPPQLHLSTSPNDRKYLEIFRTQATILHCYI